MTQESEKGSWHVPKSGNDDDVLTHREWMCITRTGHAAPGNTESDDLMVDSSSVLESSVTEIEEQAVELKDIPISGDEVQSPKPRKSRKSRKSTLESSASSSLKSSTIQTPEVENPGDNSRPSKGARSATKKSRSPKSLTVQSSDAGELEGQPKPPKKAPSTTKKSSSSKSSTLQLSAAGTLEDQPISPRRGRSTTTKPRSPKSSVLVRKLEAAEKFIEGPIHFEI